MVNTSHCLHSWGTLDGTLWCTHREEDGERTGEQADRAVLGVGGEWLDWQSRGMLPGPLGLDKNWGNEERKLLSQLNAVSCCILRVEKYNSISSDSKSISSMYSTCMCVRTFCVCGHSSTNGERKFSPSPSSVLPSSSMLLLTALLWLAGGKVRDEVLLSNLPEDRHWWASVEWL